MPEYPETSTNSGLPLATTRSKEASNVSISRARPYNFSGINSRSGVSFRQAGIVDAALSFPFSEAAPKITLSTGRCLVASSAVLASSFMMIAETEAGTFFDRSSGGIGCLATWQ